MPILSLTVATAIALAAENPDVPVVAELTNKPAATRSAAARSNNNVSSELSALDQKFREAFQKEDLEAIMSLYADDAVLMDPNVLLAKGKAEIRKTYAATFAALDNIEINMGQGYYGSSGNVGYGFGLFQIKAKEASTGVEVSVRGRNSSVMIKRDGKWIYMMDHASAPNGEASMPDPSGAVRPN